MPIFNEADKRWDLFYVAYDTGGAAGRPDLAGHFERFRAAPGSAGPTRMWASLQPDAESQTWEGSQGTDSFFPYRVKDRWLAFYGSQAGKAGLGRWGWPKHRRWRALETVCRGQSLSIEPVFIENPIVTRIGNLYVAVYDSDTVNAPDFDTIRNPFGGICHFRGRHPLVGRWPDHRPTTRPGELVHRHPDAAGTDRRRPQRGSPCLHGQNKKRFWPVSMIRLKLAAETPAGVTH